jgi:hypothetical protein
MASGKIGTVFRYRLGTLITITRDAEEDLHRACMDGQSINNVLELREEVRSQRTKVEHMLDHGRLFWS